MILQCPRVGLILTINHNRSNHNNHTIIRVHRTTSRAASGTALLGFAATIAACHCMRYIVFFFVMPKSDLRIDIYLKNKQQQRRRQHNNDERMLCVLLTTAHGAAPTLATAVTAATCNWSEFRYDLAMPKSRIDIDH